VLKKLSPKNGAAVDVPADNPVGTMDRFANGLRRVLAARKRNTEHVVKKHNKRSP
jgi:hypothetical protein